VVVPEGVVHGVHDRRADGLWNVQGEQDREHAGNEHDQLGILEHVRSGLLAAEPLRDPLGAGRDGPGSLALVDLDAGDGLKGEV